MMSIFDKYDLLDVQEGVEAPVKPSKGLTLLVGSSGTGKTKILREWGMKPLTRSSSTPIYKLFPSEETAEHFLIAAGLRSIPTWKRSLTEVSNGERHRAEVALSLAYGELYIDEFTSLVDRDTAKALCYSLNKLNLKDLTLATCHKDVLQWLDCDNIYDTDLNQWVDRGSLRRDNTLKFTIQPCCPQKVWEVFKRHHYLSGKINKSANCWVAMYNGKPIAMTSVIAFPNANWKDGWRGHRTVVLPEFQGMGIGSKLSDTVAHHIVESGGRFFSKTSHPAFGEHRNKSPNWKPTSKNGKARADYKSGRKSKEDGHKQLHANRVCYSHEYIISSS
jgi:hypothetical protein